MGSCDLCDAFNEEFRFICDNESSFCLVNIEPIKEGHVMVLPKRHVIDKKDLNLKESKDLFNLIDKLQNTLKTSYGEDPLIIMNTGRHCTQEHLHFHLLPSKGGLRKLYSNSENLPERIGGDKEMLGRIRDLVKDNLNFSSK